MIVKFFSNRGGGSAKASIDYLIGVNRDREKATILMGDADLSLKIAKSADFANKYTVGCLSFEENDIDEEDKRAIMERFEGSIFAGIDKEQYNILWVQHTDKERLELNFFIPNVELTSGKRLQPYYDKADRPLVENFKQVINYEYGLTDPNAPEKQQTLITQERLPKNKKEALEAINNGIEGLARAGQINDREGVINALEGAGFEIARVTPKNISIKTEGQNLRLKGAFYEETFRCGENIREAITDRANEYERSSAERYQRAREILNSAVAKRQQEFAKRYRTRGGETNKQSSEQIRSIGSIYNNTRSFSASSDDTSITQKISGNEGVGAGSTQLSKDKPPAENKYMQYREEKEQVLHRDRPEIQKQILGREAKYSDITNQSGVTENDRNRKTVRERIREHYKRATERISRFAERVSGFTQRERFDTSELQQNNATEYRNQRAINDIAQINKALTQKYSQEYAYSRYSNEREEGISY